MRSLCVRSGVVGLLKWTSRRSRWLLPAFHSDITLCQFSQRDFWTIRDACEGTQIFGATGSGKTSGSGRAIATNMLAQGFGGLVLTAKPDERDLWLRYCEETNRSGDVVVMDDSGQARLNLLDYEFNAAAGLGLTENLVALFTTVLESGESQSHSNDQFWQRALRQLLRNAIDLVILATGSVGLSDLGRVVASAARHPDEVRSADWQGSSFCCHLLRRAANGVKSRSEEDDLRVTTEYWLGEFPAMDERTRSNIVSTFTTMADGFQRGVLRELFCTETTLTPEATHDGAILIVDLPIKRYHELGRQAQVLVKTLWQRATERRQANDSTRPVFLWADEAQYFVTKADWEFQATARSARAATVYLTQNISSYYAAIGGPDPRSATDSLLGNFQTKIFHANGDAVTNEWAERLFAKSWGRRTNTTLNSQNRAQQGSSDGSLSTGTSESLDSEVLAQAFTTLRKGGPHNKLLVDAIVFQGGRIWSGTGKNYLPVTFSQVA